MPKSYPPICYSIAYTPIIVKRLKLLKRHTAIGIRLSALIDRKTNLAARHKKAHAAVRRGKRFLRNRRRHFSEKQRKSSYKKTDISLQKTLKQRDKISLQKTMKQQNKISLQKTLKQRDKISLQTAAKTQQTQKPLHQKEKIPKMKKADTNIRFFHIGGDSGNRTHDLLNAIQALYQLSYIPVWVRPHGGRRKEQTCAEYASAQA